MLLASTQQEDSVNEQILFDMLKDEYYPDLMRIVDEYSNFDCVSEREDMYVELKCRYTHYDDLMIEKYKYDRVKEQADLTGRIPIYICSTPEGIWEFNLDTFKIKWEDRDNLPKTTEFEDTEKVVKTVGYLPISEGKQLFSNDFDEMVEFAMNDSDLEDPYVFLDEEDIDEGYSSW
jgi:hypothetical protein